MGHCQRVPFIDILDWIACVPVDAAVARHNGSSTTFAVR